MLFKFIHTIMHYILFITIMFINLNKKQDNEIKKSSNYVNFLIDGMILFLKFIFGT